MSMRSHVLVIVLARVFPLCVWIDVLMTLLRVGLRCHQHIVRHVFVFR
ncbi:MAG: hypothetical protein LRY67_05710 [Gammaproteobacteria bacterium]|nr:hypothetical protein [Gammaproteobacteria bacterium]